MAGQTEGLTKSQAERALRKLIDVHVPTERAERMSVGDAGERYVASREAPGAVADDRRGLRLDRTGPLRALLRLDQPRQDHLD